MIQALISTIIVSSVFTLSYTISLWFRHLRRSQDARTAELITPVTSRSSASVRLIPATSATRLAGGDLMGLLANKAEKQSLLAEPRLR